MQGSFTITQSEARKSDGKSAEVKKSSVGNEAVNGKSAGEEWFANACKHLFSSKAGTALSYMSGFDERICQRYAAGHTKPPAYFLRALIRSPQGWTWLCAVMAESDEPWWREVRYAYEMVLVIEAKRKELLNGNAGGAASAARGTQGALGADGRG